MSHVLAAARRACRRLASAAAAAHIRRQPEFLSLLARQSQSVSVLAGQAAALLAAIRGSTALRWRRLQLSARKAARRLLHREALVVLRHPVTAPPNIRAVPVEQRAATRAAAAVLVHILEMVKLAALVEQAQMAAAAAQLVAALLVRRAAQHTAALAATTTTEQMAVHRTRPPLVPSEMGMLVLAAVVRIPAARKARLARRALNITMGQPTKVQAVAVVANTQTGRLVVQVDCTAAAVGRVAQRLARKVLLSLRTRHQAATPLPRHSPARPARRRAAPRQR